MPTPVRTYPFRIGALATGVHTASGLMNAVALVTAAVRTVGLVVLVTAVVLLRMVTLDFLVPVMPCVVVHVHVTALLHTLGMTGSGQLVVLGRWIAHEVLSPVIC